MRNILCIIILILSILLFTGKHNKHCKNSENFNLQDAPQNISNIQFSKMFDTIPLPSSDELAEYGGRYQMLEGIESPKIANYWKNNSNINSNTWVDVV